MTGFAVIAGAGDTAVTVIAAMRLAPGPAAIAAILPDFPVIERAMLIAALGPLAIERAPDVRIGAVDVADGAEPDSVDSAAAYLAGAESMTGQVLTVAPLSPKIYPFE